MATQKKVLKYEEIETPSVGKNQVLVKMLYAPINHSDLNIIEGTYGTSPKLPCYGGQEGVGVIESIGENVKNLKVNDNVIMNQKGLGTWRNYLVGDENSFFALPNNKDTVQTLDPKSSPQQILEYRRQKKIKLDTEDLSTYSSIFSGPCTAYRMINDFMTLEKGDVIIQNGGNSVVGQSVIQLAKERGLRTISIIRERPDQDEIVERLKMVGGDIVVSESYATSFNMQRLMSDLPKPKLALNCIGGDSVRTLSKLLDSNGLIVTYGGMSKKPIQVQTSPFIFNNLTMKGFWYTKWEEDLKNVEEKKRMITEIIDLCVHKKLTIFIQLNKFSEFQMAIDQQYAPFPQRKIVLDMRN